jgi:hypothetical protein
MNIIDNMDASGVVTLVIDMEYKTQTQEACVGGGEGLSYERPQSNDYYRGTSELVQHFAYRVSSHRRKDADRHIH